MNSYSLDYIDDLYVQYIRDPSSVSDTWREYFEQFLVGASSRSPQGAGSNGSVTTPSADGQLRDQRASKRVRYRRGGDRPVMRSPIRRLWMSRVQDRVNQLVREYRVRGHLAAKLDPLIPFREETPQLSPQLYGLSDDDLQRPLDSSALEYVSGGTLDVVVQQLQNTYCRSIGAQFMHIDNRNIRDWLQKRMETTENRLELSHEVQRRIYTRLADASIFEEFVRRKFVGAKTFSLEGAESLIPMLDLALEKAAQHNVKEVVMGMAHRGRLNVMANILKKRAMNIFLVLRRPGSRTQSRRRRCPIPFGIQQRLDNGIRRNAVTYLLVLQSQPPGIRQHSRAGTRSRCKQDRMSDKKRQEVMSILIHGDAAFAGEGVVQETLNLSQLEGYRTGGTLHIIINNQVGFTTEPQEGRSTTYATDVAKMLQIPIFHVNGEDPEAVAQVVSLAMDFRKEFQRDVVIDLYAYRRWGHNEGDEPRFTQPRMYAEIDRRSSVRDHYLQELLKLGKITARRSRTNHSRNRTTKLETEFEASKNEKFIPDTQTLAANWSDYFGGPEPVDETDTSYDIEKALKVDRFDHASARRVFGA